MEILRIDLRCRIDESMRPERRVPGPLLALRGGMRIRLPDRVPLTFEAVDYNNHHEARRTDLGQAPSRERPHGTWYDRAGLPLWRTDRGQRVDSVRAVERRIRTRVAE